MHDHRKAASESDTGLFQTTALGDRLAWSDF